MNKKRVIALLIIAVSFCAGIYLYPQMPENMASHWGASGQVNGYMSKFWGLFLMPIISLLMLLLFIFMPKIDPLKENVKKFQKHYDGFILALITFFAYLYALTLLWNLGYRFDMGKFLAPAMGILFFYCGVLIENAKRNWFIGIRTPWTLSSDKNWEKTNKLGGKLFKIAGVIAFLGIIVPGDIGFIFVIAPIITASCVVFIYSYLEYSKEVKNNG